MFQTLLFIQTYCSFQTLLFIQIVYHYTEYVKIIWTINGQNEWLRLPTWLGTGRFKKIFLKIYL